MYDNKIKKIAIDKTLKYEYFMDKSHPLSDKKGRVYYHRHIASLSIGRWIGKDEVVHHIDGNRGNNESSNLEVMSASDHAKEHKGELQLAKCEICDDEFRKLDASNIYCSCVCMGIGIRRFNPNKDELNVLVQKMPLTKIAKIFNVSDVAIKKRCVKLGIKTQKTGHWNKEKNRSNSLIG